MASALRRHVAEGLRLLGMRADTDSSPFHAWSEALPHGMFDAYRSVMPAPDHLFYNGVARDLLSACFRALSKEYKAPVLVSLREALALSGLRRTRPYNLRTGKVNSLAMSEWAATLTVAPICFERALPAHVTEVVGVRTPLQDVLHILRLFTALVRATYFSPRADLDGGDACHRAPNVEALRELASAFLSFIDASMRRSDVDSAHFVCLIDKPNLHRLREIYFYCLPEVLHVRHVRELFFESAHQPLKRAAVQGNGHNDARAAMSRMLETECFSRIAIEPAKFNVPSHFWNHAAIKKQVEHALPLYTMSGQHWRVANGKMLPEDVPACARSIARHHCHPDFSIAWRRGATRGGADYLRVGDTVSVLCRDGTTGLSMVPVTPSEEGCAHGSTVRFFFVLAFYTNANGSAVGIVHPYVPADAGLWARDSRRAMSLTFVDGVRRSLALHACDRACHVSPPTHISHSASNQWHLLGRADLYPAISG